MDEDFVHGKSIPPHMGQEVGGGFGQYVCIDLWKDNYAPNTLFHTPTS